MQPTDPQTTTPEINEPSNELVTEPTFDQSAVPAVQREPAHVVTESTPGNDVPPKKKVSKLLLVIAIAFGALLVLAGSAAAAYYTVILPNQPGQVLEDAVENTAAQTTIHLDGNVIVEADDTLFKVNFVTQSDSQKKLMSALVELELAGVSLPLEYRMIDGDVYVKLENVQEISALLTVYLQSEGVDTTALTGLISELEATINGRWIQIDESLLEQQSSCDLEQGWQLSQQDIELLRTTFENHPFITVASSGSETIDSVDSFKYELTIDPDKAADFTADASLSELSFIKQAEECIGEEIVPESNSDDFEGATTRLTVWVAKDTRLFNKISFELTSPDAESLKVEAKMTYEPVTVETPTDTVPLSTVMLQLQSLLYGGAMSDAAGYDAYFDTLEGQLQ